PAPPTSGRSRSPARTRRPRSGSPSAHPRRGCPRSASPTGCSEAARRSARRRGGDGSRRAAASPGDPRRRGPASRSPPDLGRSGRSARPRSPRRRPARRRVRCEREGPPRYRKRVAEPPYRPLDAQLIPRFAGIRTFMRAPHVTDLTGVDAAVYGIPFDTATSYRTGARFGPEAIRSASALIRPYHAPLGVNVVDSLSIVDYGDLPVSPGDTDRTYGQIEEGLAPIVDAGVFPIALGGDHSITLAELRVVARERPVALVQLDAHADTWEQYFGQKHFHGTTFKRAAEEGLVDPAASVQAGMRGSVYDASDLNTARELGFTV